MDKNQILELLEEWNFWKKEVDVGIKRETYLGLGSRFLQPNVVLALIGVRRSGKSCLMRQLAQSLIAQGSNKEEILFINFEDKRLTEYSLELMDQLYETYVEFLRPKSKPYLFLDEIHKISGWEKWVRTMHELGKAKIIISGSSAKLLSGELATLLTGRHLDVVVFPLSFREFLGFKGTEIKDQLDLVSKRIELRSCFPEYLEWGGFPEVVLSPEKKSLLLTYIDDVIAKDIEQRYEIRRSEKLRSLVRFYLSNISNPITFNSLRKFLDLSVDTIEKFSSYLEEANLIFFLKRFSFTVKEQEKSPRKVYAIDVGLANAFGFKFSENKGLAVENLVALELKRKQALNPLLEVYYWKNLQQEEVDFVVKEGLEVKQLIQVCVDVSRIKTKERELRSMCKALEEFKLGEGLVITEDYEAEEEVKGKKIKFIPVWRWLLKFDCT
jgi:predicted AAA+ superfamily ATPase